MFAASNQPGSRDTLTKENRKVCSTYSRMKRFRDQLPAVIRPDIIPTQDGMVITELDSVPGGIGMTACLSALYADREAAVVSHSWEAPRGWYGDLQLW